MAAIVTTRDGDGPEILLVHGGASPDATWGALAPLRHAVEDYGIIGGPVTCVASAVILLAILR